jgi:anti-sigma B factor antagonist
MLRITTRTVGGIAVVEAEGRVTGDDGTSAQLRSVLRDAADWSPKIIVNVERVSYMDSSGISELITATTTRGHQVKLLYPNQYLRRLLEMSKLDGYLDIHFDEEAALKSFK